eukprot:gnl/MRDRNA2_/MRDRNA2_111128_c0_seq1.p1 gnl/MRDRNA2_/MRDRNA2_111128_c0~~gnl/MRDRNA2_/MRDRNA2_111128_c0_seq1.p1  ORF type:complete len:195 (-),score=27.39 gnl/MRDRNA2_/MRDRNA2_111128_c0_seq1:100-684(-)
MSLISRVWQSKEKKPRWSSSDAAGLHTFQAPKKRSADKPSDHVLVWGRHRYALFETMIEQGRRQPTPLFREPTEAFFQGLCPPTPASPLARARDRADRKERMPGVLTGATASAWQVPYDTLPHMSDRLQAAIKGMAQDPALSEAWSPTDGTPVKVSERKKPPLCSHLVQQPWVPEKRWGSNKVEVNYSGPAKFT